MLGIIIVSSLLGSSSCLAPAAADFGNFYCRFFCVFCFFRLFPSFLCTPCGLAMRASARRRLEGDAVGVFWLASSGRGAETFLYDLCQIVSYPQPRLPHLLLLPLACCCPCLGPFALGARSGSGSGSGSSLAMLVTRID